MLDRVVAAMTKEELEAQAHRLITGAKYSIELQGNFDPVFMLHHPSGGWKPYRMPPGTEEILNSGSAKTIFVDALRRVVKETGCDAVICCTDTWVATSTEEGMKHIDTPEMQHPKQGFDELVKRGWMIRKEAITLTAQSATDALLISQEYQRLGNRVQLLKAKRGWNTQSKFRGRLKMFGDLREENLS
jgi:hypothetical protein